MLYHSTTLDNLIKTMEVEGFVATSAMYKKKFRDWGWRKYLNRELAVEAAKKRARREEDGHMSSITVINGKEVSNDKIDRHVKRHKVDLTQARRDPPAGTMTAAAAVVVHTPESQNADSPSRISAYRASNLGQLPSQIPDGTAAYSIMSTSSNAGTGFGNSAIAVDSHSARTSAAIAILPQVAMPHGYPGDPWDGIEMRNMYSYDIETNYFDPNFHFDFGTIGFNTPRHPSQSAHSSPFPPVADMNVPKLAKMRQPIHQAAQNGHTNTVKILLRIYPNCVDVQGKEGETPLHLAAQEGHTEIVEALIDARANPHLKVENIGRGAIHQAAQSGHLGCIRLLLAAGAHPDEPDSTGATPFFLTCSGGFEEVARLLRSTEPSIDVNARATKSNRRPIHQAAQGNHLSTVKFLIEAGAIIEQGEDDGASALWLACQDGHVEVADLLINHGADVNKPTSNSRRRPIHQAAQNGHLKVIELLRDRGADLDAGESDGATPLWIASQQGFIDIVNILLAQQANPNTRVIRSSRSPLHQAAQNGHVDVAAALLASGANVNAVEEDGWPPLMLAAQQGSEDMANLLVANGADINLREVKGGTPLWIAAQQGHVKIAEMLLQNGATATGQWSGGRQPIHQAAQNGHLDMIKLLLKYGSEVDCKTEREEDETNVTPLWLASQGGYDAIVEFLLENGASAVIGG